MNVFSVPFSGGSLGKNDGCEKAPQAILSNMPSLNCANNKVVITNNDVVVFPLDFPATQLNIIKTVKFPSIILGGDHSITYASFKAFAMQHTNAALVVFDAHPDLMQEFETPTHENYLRMLVSESILKSGNLVILGIRAVDEEELNYLREKGIKYYSATDCVMRKEDICDEAMAFVKNANALYLSIDIDCVDPAFAPATGYPEPGGLSSNDILYFISRFRMMKNFKGGDIVEANPSKDINKITCKLAARILADLC
ncbi:arginase family protein [Candidatus Woesearchaeota archaeon]|nr:arginase family protein [Candidatus Woesearchaeota archaeon]